MIDRASRRAALLVSIALMSSCIITFRPATAGHVAYSQDDLLAAISVRVPQFGGLFFSTDQSRVNIWVTDGSRRTALRALHALQETFNDGGLRRATVVPLKAHHNFATLKSWHDEITATAFSIRGVTMNDIDDSANRLTIGVDRIDRVEPAVRRLLSRFTFPRTRLA